MRRNPPAEEKRDDGNLMHPRTYIEWRGARLWQAGNVLFGGGAIDCTVRNLSQTGAALDVASPMGIPEDITLLIPADGKQFGCRVVWRKERRIGVMSSRLERTTDRSVRIANEVRFAALGTLAC